MNVSLSFYFRYHQVLITSCLNYCSNLPTGLLPLVPLLATNVLQLTHFQGSPLPAKHKIWPSVFLWSGSKVSFPALSATIFSSVLYASAKLASHHSASTFHKNVSKTTGIVLLLLPYLASFTDFLFTIKPQVLSLRQSTDCLNPCMPRSPVLSLTTRPQSSPSKPIIQP